MNKYIANDGDRIDTIVYKTYGTLEPLWMVFEANRELLNCETLKSGDVVILPPYEPKPKEETKALWS